MCSRKENTVLHESRGLRPRPRLEGSARVGMGPGAESPPAPAVYQVLLCGPYPALWFGLSRSQFPSLLKEGWPGASTGHAGICFPRGLTGAFLPDSLGLHQ